MKRKDIALAYVSGQAYPSSSIVTIIIVIQFDVIKREVFHQDVLLDDFRKPSACPCKPSHQDSLG